MPLKHEHQAHTQKLKVFDLKKLLILTLPLGFVEMIASFNVNTPKYFIESEIGIAQLCVFSSLAYFMVAGGTAVYAIGQAAMPRLAKHFADKNRYEFFKLFTGLSYFCVLVGLIGIIIAVFGGEYLLDILYGPEYSAYNNTFIAIMIASALNYMATIMWFGIASTWKFIQQIYIFGCSLIVNLIACYFLVPSFGIIGGAIAFSAAELTRIFISSIILFGIFKQGFHHIEYSTK
jgi:O-antigen/teichoic acid export membrane protein